MYRILDSLYQSQEELLESHAKLLLVVTLLSIHILSAHTTHVLYVETFPRTCEHKTLKHGILQFTKGTSSHIQDWRIWLKHLKFHCSKLRLYYGSLPWVLTMSCATQTGQNWQGSSSVNDYSDTFQLPQPEWNCLHFKFPTCSLGFFSACFCEGKKSSNLN